MDQITNEELAANALRKAIADITRKNVSSILGEDPYAKYKDKTDDELIEMYFEENPTPRPKDIQIQSINLFNDTRVSENLQNIAESIEQMPDSEIKTQMRFMYRVINQAAFERDSIAKEANHWKQKSDDLFCLYIKETWLKQIKRATAGSMGRAY